MAPFSASPREARAPPRASSFLIDASCLRGPPLPRSVSPFSGRCSVRKRLDLCPEDIIVSARIRVPNGLFKEIRHGIGRRNSCSHSGGEGLGQGREARG